MAIRQNPPCPVCQSVAYPRNDGTCPKCGYHLIMKREYSPDILENTIPIHLCWNDGKYLRGEQINVAEKYIIEIDDQTAMLFPPYFTDELRLKNSKKYTATIKSLYKGKILYESTFNLLIGRNTEKVTILLTRTTIPIKKLFHTQKVNTLVVENIIQDKPESSY